MHKKSKRMTFHGAFKSKTRAVRKEREVHGFIRRIVMRGSVRYVVMKARV